MYRIRNGQNVRWTITECACGTRPGNVVTCPVVDRSQLRSNGHQRIHRGYLQDVERMRTGQSAHEPDKPHTKAWVTFIHRTYLSGDARSKFWIVQNLPTDTCRTGQNGYRLTRNAFTAWRTNKKRMQTDTNGQRILLSVTRPLVLSGKGW